MHDRMAPQEARLFALADDHLGYFTAKQARASGYTSSMLAYHVARGHFLRAGWGVYRFARYPYSAHEHVIAGWLGAGPDAVVSHETALDFFALSDVIPDSVHLTIPRNRRSRHPPIGVTLHTIVQPLEPGERTVHQETGVPITTPVRTLVDVASAGSPAEVLDTAVADAVRTGLATADQLRDAAQTRGPAVREAVAHALDRISHKAAEAGGGTP